VTVLAPKAIAAVLVQTGLTADAAAALIMLQIALAESGGELDRVDGDRRGLFMISDSYGYDRAQMVTDAAYACRAALEITGGGRRPHAFLSYREGRHASFDNVARQAMAQAAPVSGSVLAEDGTYVPPSFYNTLSPQYAATLSGTPGVGSPLGAAYEQEGPLTGLRVTGTELTGDISSSVIGAPSFEAGWTTVPNLSFTIADPEGDLLWHQRNLWVQGARVEYLDLDMRIDTIEFSPGPASTGQLAITAVDNVVYQLQQLRGARTARNVSPTDFVRQELSLAGVDPVRFFLGEQMPSQAEVARDIPDQGGQSGGGEIPSGWTTVQRLAKETGKRVFISGRKLVFGSAQFAMDWCAPGDLRIGWHQSPEAERWLSLPSAKTTSVGERDNITEVSGKVPLNRARFFRPGVSVIVHHTPAIATADRRFVCTQVSHTLSRDTDGADITLIEPVELTAEAKT
jgi:hypothetical protein